MRDYQRREVAYTGLFVLLLMGATPRAGRAQNQTHLSASQPPTDQSPTGEPPSTVPPAQTPGGGESGILANPTTISHIVPNYFTVNDVQANQGPLTTGQKYKLAWVSSEDYSAHLGNLVQAGIQLFNGEPHYGRNLGAFGKRFAAQEGDQLTSEMFMRGVLPSLLKEDPRYFRAGRGSAWDRVSHAVSQAFVTRTDSGGHAFNTPSILGQFMQAGVSNLYYPRQDRSVHGTVEDVGINVVYGAAFNMVKEFYPDILAKLKIGQVTVSPATAPHSGS